MRRISVEFLDGFSDNARCQFALLVVEVALFNRRDIPGKNIRLFIRPTANSRVVGNCDCAVVLLCRHCQSDALGVRKRVRVVTSNHPRPI